jgi:hypothetical protein
MHERRYASTDDYAYYTGEKDPPDGLDRRLLVRASRAIDTNLIGVVYDTDGQGMPTDPRLRDVLREATCAQAAWWWSKGDRQGTGIITTPAEWDQVSIGDVRLARSSPAQPAPGPGARHQLAPDAEAVLRTAGLLPAYPVVWG